MDSFIIKKWNALSVIMEALNAFPQMGDSSSLPLSVHLLLYKS